VWLSAHVRQPLFASLLICAACECNKGLPDSGTGRSVEVAQVRTLVHNAGTSEAPFALADTSFSALVADDAGQRVVYPLILGPGSARFDDLPFGPYFLTFSNYNIRTNENRVDLGLVSLGRATAGVTDGGTSVQLDLTGLEPWEPASDVLQLTSENAGYVALNAQSHVVEPPDAGATAARFDLDWLRACSSLRFGLATLVDADAGDVLTVTQLRSERVADAGMLELRTLVRAGTVGTLTVADHGATPIAVALAPPATIERFDLDYRQSLFEALKGQVHPQATTASSSVLVTAVPYTAEHGSYTAAPDLAVLRPQQTATDVRLAFDTGNPFPASWPKYVTARYLLQVDYAFPDGGSRAVTTALVTQDLLGNVDGGPLAPRISPPRAVKIDGADALTRRQISRRPVLTWDPPLAGTPSSYGVTLYRFTRVGSGPVIAVSEVAFFEIVETRLEVPFGEVEPGGEYAFGVTAFDAPGTDVQKAPFKGAFPFGQAAALTAMMRVDPALMNGP